MNTMKDYSGWLSPTGQFIPRGEDHFTSLPRKHIGTLPSPRLDATREGTTNGYSRLKHLGDQMNVDCLAEKMQLVEAWVRKNTGVARVQFHIWSSDGRPLNYCAVEITRRVTTIRPDVPGPGTSD
jgi:hypothetical protein